LGSGRGFNEEVCADTEIAEHRRIGRTGTRPFIVLRFSAGCAGGFSWLSGFLKFTILTFPESKSLELQ